MLIRALIPALAIAFAVACTPGPAGNPTVAAVVNGDDIPVAEVERRFSSAKANPQLAAQLEQDTEGLLREEVQAELLTQLIQSRLLEQGAETLGVTITDADVADQRAQVVAQVGGEDAFDQIVEQFNLTPEDVDQQLRELAVRDRVEEHLTAGVEVTRADIRQFYDEQRATRYERASARHILVESQAEAEGVLDRLEAGEDFAALAEELSIDPGSAAEGGNLGEFTRGRMVPEFEEAVFDAEVGELVGPVQTAFGYHIIEVLSREDRSLAEVSDEIREELGETRRGQVVQDWLQDQLRDAEVEVNPRFGRWDDTSGRVVPSQPLDEPPPPAGQIPVEEPGLGE